MSKKDELLQTLIDKAIKDKQFRNQLVNNPREAIGNEFGFKIPENIQVNVLEEDANTIYITLPAKTPTVQEFELPDAELAQVAGGTEGYTNLDSFCYCDAR